MKIKHIISAWKDHGIRQYSLIIFHNNNHVEPVEMTIDTPANKQVCVDIYHTMK